MDPGGVDGGAYPVLDDFRLIEHALSALAPFKWAILQRSEMKGTLVYRWPLTAGAAGMRGSVSVGALRW